MKVKTMNVSIDDNTIELDRYDLKPKSVFKEDSEATLCDFSITHHMVEVADRIVFKGGDGKDYVLKDRQQTTSKAMEYEKRITRMTVLPVGEPIFSPMATNIEIQDEAAGEFIVLRQCTEGGKSQEISFNSGEDWKAVKEAVDEMFSYIKQ